MANRFMRKGTTKIFFVETISNLATPTAAEINAGTNMTPQIAEVAGFSFQSNPISTPDLDTRFASQIAGEDTADNSSITLYELTNGTDTVHDALDKDLTGYICIFYGGIAGATPAAADKLDIWPVTITSNTRMYSAGNEAAQYRVSFAITDDPTEGETLT